MTTWPRSASVLIGCAFIVILGAARLDEATIQEITQEVMASLTQQTGGLPEFEGPERDAQLRTMYLSAYWGIRGHVGVETALLLGIASLTYVVIQWVQPAAGRPRPSLARLAPWDGFLWILIGALGLVVIGVGQAGVIGWNLLLFSIAVYWARGMGVLDGRLAMRRLSLLFRALTLVGLLVISFFSLLLPIAALGLFDTWFDFRHLRPRLADAGGQSSQGG